MASPIIKIKRNRNSSDDDSALIQVSTDSGDGKIGVSKITEIADKYFSEIVQNEIVEYCKILTSSFEKLKLQSVPPKKVAAEFGIQATGEGDVYLAKVSANANFKISIEWEF